MKEKKEIKVDKKGLREVCKKFNLKLVILFGSYASRKGVKQKSDIDICILCKDVGHIIDNDLRILQALSRVFGSNRIDLTYLNYADPLLLLEVVKNGVLLFQDKKGRFAEFKITALKKHFDAQKFYRLEDLCLEKFIQKKA